MNQFEIQPGATAIAPRSRRPQQRQGRAAAMAPMTMVHWTLEA